MLRTLQVSTDRGELNGDGSEVQNGYIGSFFGPIAAPKAELLILHMCRAFGAFRVLALTLFLRLALTDKQEVAPVLAGHRPLSVCRDFALGPISARDPPSQRRMLRR
jgi:hypothetical protein